MPRLASLIAALAAISMLAFATERAAAPTAAAQARLSVLQEDARSYKLSRPDAPAVRLTFLTATAFRVHVLAEEEEAARLINYMRVKPDASFPPVPLKVESGPATVTFVTSAIEVRLAAEDRAVVVNVRAGTTSLIEN